MLTAAGLRRCVWRIRSNYGPLCMCACAPALCLCQGVCVCGFLLSSAFTACCVLCAWLNRRLHTPSGRYLWVCDAHKSLPDLAPVAVGGAATAGR